MNRARFTLMMSTIFSLLLYGREVPLPQNVLQKAVYHVHVKQLDDFSCGYNVLFNAANFEQLCGFNNRASDYSIFRSYVLPYLRSQGFDPSHTSTNVITDQLAHKVLGLQPFYHLHVKKERGGRVVPLLVDKTRISFPSGTSEKEIQRLMKEAVAARQQDVIDALSSMLNKKSYAVVHFLCYVTSQKGVRHGILLSLLKNSSGRGLYIFDNLNEQIVPHSEAKRFIDYLCQTFKISSAKSFSGPSLPEQWPSIR